VQADCISSEHRQWIFVGSAVEALPGSRLLSLGICRLGCFFNGLEDAPMHRHGPALGH
jgi:hypothetical protein